MVVQLKYEQVKILSDDQFRRLTGVKRGTFDKMVKILEAADKKKKTKGGRRNKLSMANQLLMALEYIREYRTYFHRPLA
ncbi:IS5 family transposase domain protein [Rickettsiales endosymbiont of Paramecium tredecaurelia]|nr:IS5 family transposase domain protein [Candidatus Sarmatiella mevalonica]